MEESREDRNVCTQRNEQKRLLFGDFNDEDYDKYFSVNAIVHPNPVEFSFERQHNISDWINEGTWYVSFPSENLIPTDLDLPLSPVDPPKQVSESTSESTSIVEKVEIDEQSSSGINGDVSGKVAAAEQSVKKAAEEVKPSPVIHSTWASLFSKPDTPKPTSKYARNLHNTKLVNGEPNVSKTKLETSGKGESNPIFDFLSSHPSTIVKQFTLQLRGLINSSNWCFINATLQALLASPCFYQLYATFPKCVSEHSSPLTISMIEFIGYFQKLKISETTTKPPTVVVSTGTPFEPKAVYDALPSSESSLSEKGRQQDAEEFLSFLLNGLHDELVAAKAEQQEPKESKRNKKVNGDIGEKHVEESETEKEWQQVGPKNKSALTRETRHEQTFITNIFSGSLRSSVRQSGAKESVTLQPFFTLPLDIQAENTKNVSDALRHFFAKECLQGYTCQKTNSQVEASRKTSLESLPTVLILQLKYFLYDQSGGCQKIHKPIAITINLNLTKEMMASTAKTISPAYSLFAVVYHHGKSAADGHYTAAVRDRSTKEPYPWVHCDDSVIEPYSINDVIRHQHGRTPYLLFYERTHVA